MAHESLELLIVNFKESSEREMMALYHEMRSGFAQVNVRFDIQAARLERHAALLQTGNRWVARMNEWNEKIDQALEAKDRQIADLIRRVQALEDKARTENRST